MISSIELDDLPNSASAKVAMLQVDAALLARPVTTFGENNSWDSVQTNCTSCFLCDFCRFLGLPWITIQYIHFALDDQSTVAAFPIFTAPDAGSLMTTGHELNVGNFFAAKTASRQFPPVCIAQ